MLNMTRHRQKGIAASEFAITLPVLLVLMLATAELGRAFFQYNTLEKSVRDAARYLSDVAEQDGTKLIQITADIEGDVKNLVVYGTRNGTGLPILPNLETDDVTVAEVPGIDHVQVSVAYVFQSILGNSIPTFGLGNGNINTSLTFNVSTIMRAL